jgi:hypothetical protein
MSDGLGAKYLPLMAWSDSCKVIQAVGGKWLHPVIMEFAGLPIAQRRQQENMLAAAFFSLDRQTETSSYAILTYSSLVVVQLPGER